MGVVYGGRQMVIPDMGLRVRALRSAAAAAPWYRAGGAPEPIAAYAFKNAASYTAAKINLAHPGIYDATDGSAYPTWNIATGCTFNGIDQYLTTGIIPQGNWSWLIRFANGPTRDLRQAVCGAYDYSVGDGYLLGFMPTYDGGAYMWGYHQVYLSGSPALTAGVCGVAGKTAYRNGINDGGRTENPWLPNSAAIALGAIQAQDFVCFAFWSGDITHFVIWSTDTGHATWMPAVSAAMAAL